MSGSGRRRLLWLAGAGAMAPLGAGAQQAAGRAQAQAQAPYAFLNAFDAAFLRAACDRLIPADDFPSASEAGVLTYIDRQLAGPYGRGERMYLAGPHRPGLPEQGYQLGLAPAALYRESLDALASDPRGQGFAASAPERQDELLRELEGGRWMLGPVPSSVFFETLLANVVEGYFADPLYGGNQGMAGWRMIGFPGAYAHYTQWVGRHNVRFNRPPVAIATTALDRQRGHGHGHEHGNKEPDPRVPASARPRPPEGR